MPNSEPPSTLPALFCKMARTRGAIDAVVMADASVDYAELDRRSARMARAFLAAGAGKGTRIALLAPDGIFWITAYLAALRIGALLTLVSTLSTPRELAHIVRHSDVQFLIAARRFMRHDYGEDLQKAFPGITSQTRESLAITDAPFLRTVWFDDPTGLEWAGSVEDLLALADAPGAPGPEILAAAEDAVTPSEDAVVIYTSGSTAAPKAVVHSQWTITRHSPELAKLFLIKPDDRMLPMLPAFWLGGLAMAMQVISQGATLVYPDDPDLETVLDTIIRCNVNRVNGWGDGLNQIRSLAQERGVDVDAIVGLGLFRDEKGELIPPQLCSNMLGMSESFAPHSAEPLNFRLPEDKPYASGRAVNNYERRVVDPETGKEVPAGKVGELQLRGAGLMTGFYKKRPNEVFTPDGFYPTGDLVKIDADGYLTFVARRGDMIKTRSANVSRLEVEAAVNALPGVELAVVTGLDDAEFGQLVAAAVVSAQGADRDPEGLRSALRETLSSYKVPKRIVYVEESDIPRTATGKLKLHELAQLIETRS